MIDDTYTRRAGSRYGKGRSTAALISVKIAVFAPMPSARMRTIRALWPGAFAKLRSKLLVSGALWYPVCLACSSPEARDAPVAPVPASFQSWVAEWGPAERQAAPFPVAGQAAAEEFVRSREAAEPAGFVP